MSEGLSGNHQNIGCELHSYLKVQERHCLRVRYRTPRLQGYGYGSGTGHLDTDSRGPVPDSEPSLSGMSRGPVVSEATTDKSIDTGPYLHIYVVTVYFTNKNSC